MFLIRLKGLFAIFCSATGSVRLLFAKNDYSLYFALMRNMEPLNSPFHLF